MQRVPVRSSHLVAVGWEPLSEDDPYGTMEVEFRKGVVYRYTEVPRTMFQELLFAESPGKYLREHIDRSYDGVRIE